MSAAPHFREGECVVCDERPELDRIAPCTIEASARRVPGMALVRFYAGLPVLVERTRLYRVRDASDVRPYRGPSQWREVAKRFCTCGWNALWHAESWRCLVVRSDGAMKRGPCAVFRNAAVHS